MKNLFLILILFESSSVLLAQNSVNDVFSILNNGDKRLMIIIAENDNMGEKSFDINDGDNFFLFDKDGTVILSFYGKESQLNYTVKTEDGVFFVIIAEETYEFRVLSSKAPVCKGNANCIRLSKYALGKGEYTHDIYLTYETNGL